MRLRLFLFLLTMSCLVAPNSSRAIGVPSNALSQATGMPTTLLDGPQLDYAFPARSLLHDSLVGGLGRDFETILVQVNDGRIGGLLHRGRDLSLDSSFGANAPTRLGIALRTGKFHWSVSGEYDLGESEERDERGSPELVDTDVDRGEVWRVGLGGGYQDGRLQVDLRATLGTEDLQAKSVRASSPIYQARVTDLERELYVGAEGRVRFPVADDVSLMLTGYVEDGSVDASLLFEGTSASGVFSETWNPTPDPFRWGIATAVEVRRDEKLRVVGFGHLSREVATTDLRLDANPSAWRHHEYGRDTRGAQVGAVVRYEAWTDTEFLMGVRIDRNRRIDRYRRVDGMTDGSQPTIGTTDERETTTIDERFSWGVQQRWRGFELVGAVDTSLDIDDLFLSLDAIYSF